MKAILSTTVAVAVLSTASIGYAQNCQNLERNTTWNEIMAQISDDMQSERYDQALEKAKKLENICANSPTLNYVISKIYHHKDDGSKELYYLQLATRQTTDFAVDPDLLEKIWADRIYVENPDMHPDSIAKTKKEITSLQAELERTKLITGIVEDTHQFNEVLMWSGTGVGALGVIMTITGATLVATYKDDSVKFSTDRQKAAANGAYVAGWGVLAAGLTATVVGATLAGYGGYQYKRTLDYEKSLTINLNATGALMTLSF